MSANAPIPHPSPATATTAARDASARPSDPRGAWEHLLREQARLSEHAIRNSGHDVHDFLDLCTADARRIWG